CRLQLHHQCLPDAERYAVSHAGGRHRRHRYGPALRHDRSGKQPGDRERPSRLDYSRHQLVRDEEERYMLKHPLPRGFTLIEVMISLTVLGILLMIALPNFSEWLQNQQLRAASEATLNGLQVARAAAIRRNVPVQFVSGPATAWTVMEVGTGVVVQSRAHEEGSPNAVLTITPAPATTVTFAPLGSVVANADGSATVTQFVVSNPAGGSWQPAGRRRCPRGRVSGGGRRRGWRRS